MIGLLTPRTELYGPTSSMIAVEVAAREAGFFVSLASVADTSAAALGAAVEHFKDQAAEAVVLIAPEFEWLTAARIVATDIPVVTMCADTGAIRPSLVGVAMDNRAGARMMTEHLLELGHRGVAFVAGPSTSSEAKARSSSWRDVMTAAGLSADRCYAGDWSSASGYEAGARLAGDGPPTAVFAANDQMALGVIAALTEAGLRVPGDVSVAGFDDVPDAAYFTPSLTTVHQDFGALASRCVAVLDRILRGEPARGRAHPPRAGRAGQHGTAAPLTDCRPLRGLCVDPCESATGSLRFRDDKHGVIDGGVAPAQREGPWHHQPPNDILAG